MMWNLIKIRAIKKYYKVLPKVLAKDYSKSDFYTSGQIKTAIKNHKLSSSYMPYALAMFVSFEDIGAVFESEYPIINGYKIRAEVADLLFAGDMHFVIKLPAKISEQGNSGIDPMPGGTQ